MRWYPAGRGLGDIGWRSVTAGETAAWEAKCAPLTSRAAASGSWLTAERFGNGARRSSSTLTPGKALIEDSYDGITRSKSPQCALDYINGVLVESFP